MRKIIVSNLASLDGFFESTDGKLDWCITDEEFFAYAKELLNAADTLLFGAATYEHMAAYWPTAPADAIEEKMNGLSKVVFSKVLQKVEWNNSRLVAGDIEEEVRALKEQPGKDIVIFGSTKLASFLLKLGLIDEYRVIVQPVLLGKGRPLFADVTTRMPLKLNSARTFGSGVVLLSYRR